MIIDVITIFPEIFESFLKTSIVKRSIDKGIVKINLHNPRDFTTDKHRTVDEPPYGGGGGMVLKIEPIVKWLEKISKERKKVKKILLTPSGKKFSQKMAIKLSKEKNIIFICGHYEGMDERIKYFIDEEISIGDYVLTGGELPAMVVIDSMVRLIPKVLGNPDSVKFESFIDEKLDFPHYTRPANFKGYLVPKVLLSGNHKKIEEWRKKEALKRTKSRRPDLLRNELRK
ncbi:MAG: tRNA (guanosine(37)-N1)-methyltransferase TrmD [Candidatus Firestonebacteria bacterium]